MEDKNKGNNNNESELNYKSLLGACLLFGCTGIHRFFTGYKLIGSIQLLCLLIAMLTHFELISVLLGTWVIYDLISIATGAYRCANNQVIKGTPILPHPVLIRNVTLVMLIGIVLFFIKIAIDVEDVSTENNAKKQNVTLASHNPHKISKATFNGKWALDVDEAEIYCVDLGFRGTGTKVLIHGKAYTLTRNIPNMDFLPNNLWRNGDKKQRNPNADDFCMSMDGTNCKIPLNDMVNYADTLCKI